MLRKVALAGVSIASLVGLAPVAQAQVARVFVSVGGNDANICSNVLTPCRTLAGGITQVDPDGEVIVMDSGSYAGGTITKAVKVNVASGVVAFSGLPIVINPGAGKLVVLRGLTVKAASPGAGIGINHQSGTLYVENSVVDGWYDGLESQSGSERLFVKDSVFRNNGEAGLMTLFGAGLVAIDQSFFEGNAQGGINLSGGTGRVSNTVMTGNGLYGAIVQTTGTDVTFQRCELSGNGEGLHVAGNAVTRISESTVTRNSIGLYNASGTIESFGNNVVRSNTTNTSGSIGSVALQ